MVSQLEPLRFWNRAKGAQSEQISLYGATFGGYRLNQQMIGVGFTAESALGVLDKQWCLYNQIQSVLASKQGAAERRSWPRISQRVLSG